MNEDYKTITKEEFDAWEVGVIFGDHKPGLFYDVLTGEYPLEEAREDLLSFRVKLSEATE